jgi:hypothetical protein
MRERKKAPKFVQKNSYSFKFFTGTRELHNELMKIDAIPLTIVFDNQGNVLDQEFGCQEIEDLQIMIEDF